MLLAVEQLSIWDNAAMEQGYQSLSKLQFSEASLQFGEALRSADDKVTLENALAACRYWQSRIPVQSENEYGQGDLELVIGDLIRYPFTGSLLGLRKSLLLHMAATAGDAREISLSLLETLFDLLLALPELPTAIQLIRLAISQYPERKYLLYFLGQAEWRKGDKAEAKANYIRACLQHPGEDHSKRIEIEQLKGLSKQHGPAWAPAYGWINGFLPLILLREETIARSEDHQKALAAYTLLALSEDAIQKNDLKTSVRCRKEINAIKPELFQAYFRLLQQRKGILLLTGNND